MKELINIPLVDMILEDYGGSQGIRELCERHGLSGVEAIWGGMPIETEVQKELVVGWHLGFYCDWLDFWRGDEAALKSKFGNREAWESFYGGKGRTALIEMYRADLKRAEDFGAEYVVFHVTDVSIEEGYTYEWIHSDEEVVDGAIELINTILAGEDYGFKFLVENLHWAGFSFRNPEITKKLIDGIGYPNKGIMLDIGHLMCTNTEIGNQSEGVDYVLSKIREHGDLKNHIKGLHLHQSVSGEYVKKHIGMLPKLPEDYLERFNVSYSHILNIDRHEAFSDSRVREIVELVKPEFLVHEIASKNRQDKEEKVAVQRRALWAPV